MRYTNDCYLQIKTAEEALSKHIKGTDTAALEEAIIAAKLIGASQPLIEDGIVGLERLRAQIALQEAMAAVEAQRPLQAAAVQPPCSRRAAAV